jgi:cell division protein FtsZ
MSKFRKGVEVIWGVATDETLDNRVKITVLATGFGVDDVPEIDARHKAQSEEDEEQKEKDAERIASVYGESAGIGGQMTHPRRLVYLFNAEDLDNDALISLIDDSPTYRRKKSGLAEIQAKAVHAETNDADNGTDSSGVINFG